MPISTNGSIDRYSPIPYDSLLSCRTPSESNLSVIGSHRAILKGRVRNWTNTSAIGGCAGVPGAKSEELVLVAVRRKGGR